MVRASHTPRRLGAMQSSLEALKEAVDAGVGSYEKRVLRSMRKQSYICSAGCCDGDKSEAGLHACLQACAAPVDSVEESLSRELGELQGRLQRSLAVCQDRAQGALRDGAKPEKAQTLMDNCVQEAATSATKELPKLFSRLK